MEDGQDWQDAQMGSRKIITGRGGGGARGDLLSHMLLSYMGSTSASLTQSQDFSAL